MQVPFFSVVIPLYNKQDFISQTLNSVWSQEFQDFEVIVVDDGSTDSSLSTVQQFRDSRLRVFTQQNQGVSSARNVGMKNARAPWIAFLDADDFWGIEHLMELERLVLKYPEAGMVSSAFWEVKEESELVFSGRQLRVRTNLIDYFAAASRDISVVFSSSVAVAKKTASRIGGFQSVSYGEDLEYWARVALHHPVAVSSRKTVAYVRGRDGAMENMEKVVETKDLLDNTTLHSISPSVRMLIEHLAHAKDIELRRGSIIRYINSRLSSAIFQNWVCGNIDTVVLMSRLFLIPVTRESRKWYFFSRMPRVAIAVLQKARVAVRATYRFSRDYAF